MKARPMRTGLLRIIPDLHILCSEKRFRTNKVKNHSEHTFFIFVFKSYE